MGQGEFFEESPDKLILRESGVWVESSSHTQEYFQETFYLLGEKSLLIHRPHKMFNLKFSEKSPESSSIHHCMADQYKLKMTWKNDHFFTQDIIVKGPKKDYSLFVEFKRAAAS